MKLIDKDAVLAELEKLYKGEIDTYTREILGRAILSIDSLKVKEVNLEKEIDNYIYTDNGRQRLILEFNWKQCNTTFSGGNLIDFAKHFFELGLKAQKGGEV